MTCRRREQQRRYSHGLEPLARLPRGVRESRLRMPRDELELAYWAGLFDGEGCITRANGRLILQVGMTDLGVILRLRQIGGTIRTEHPPGNRKPLYRWRVMARREVIEFLGAITPHLKVKYHDALVALNELLELERAA
jgi:hypothetical protein